MKVDVCLYYTNNNNNVLRAKIFDLQQQIPVTYKREIGFYLRNKDTRAALSSASGNCLHRGRMLFTWDVGHHNVS